MDSEYDKVLEKIKKVDIELKSYLKEQCKHFGCNVSYLHLLHIVILNIQFIVLQLQVQYFGSDKKRYQLEVPEAASKRAGDGYELQSQKKGYKRFVTEETKVCHYCIIYISCKCY